MTTRSDPWRPIKLQAQSYRQVNCLVCTLVVLTGIVQLAIQMLLELEAAYDEADTPGSLMDRVLMGLITSIRKLQPHILCT